MSKQKVVRWAVLVFLLAGLGASAEVRSVRFYCEPRDAAVFLQIPASAPYVLGRADKPIVLDLKLLEGRGTATFVFRRPGYADETRQIGAHYFNGNDRYPEASQGPVRLTPRGDLTSRWAQLGYLARFHGTSLALVAVVLAVAAWVLLTRLARLRRAARRAAYLDSLTPQLGSDPTALTRLGKYRLLEKLGTGGMGSVYKAVAEDSAELVAIKLMDKHLAMDDQFRRRFEREIKTQCGLNHPNVVQVLDWGEQDGTLYLVMELLDGEPLDRKIPEKGMPVEQALDYAGQAASGLAAAHARGIVHRDVKPENLFVTRNGRVKVTDFGIARGTQMTVVTATGYALGTPAYMAPEHVQGGSEQLDPRSDQYSLGIVIYQMLTGQPPFVDPDPFAVAFMHAGKRPPSMPSHPIELQRALFRMLEKEPDRRYSSLEEAMEGLRQAAAK